MLRPMKRSNERSPTTHTGSLPTPTYLLAMIQARETGQPVDAAALAARVESAVAEVVDLQVKAGVDIVSDGEMGKPSFATYVTHRVAGFGGENPEPRIAAEWEEFPELAAQAPRSTMRRQFCVGPLEWRGAEAVSADARNLSRA